MIFLFVYLVAWFVLGFFFCYFRVEKSKNLFNRSKAVHGPP